MKLTGDSQSSTGYVRRLLERVHAVKGVKLGGACWLREREVE